MLVPSCGVKMETRCGKTCHTAAGQRLKQIRTDCFGKSWKWGVHSAMQKYLFQGFIDGHKRSVGQMRFEQIACGRCAGLRAEVCAGHSGAEPRDAGIGSTAGRAAVPAECQAPPQRERLPEPGLTWALGPGH